jgi:hypothetical protein
MKNSNKIYQQINVLTKAISTKEKKKCKATETLKRKGVTALN